MNANVVMSALRRMYPSDQYALLQEVSNEPAGGRRADAVVIGLWESRGLTWSGIEVKVSKQDLKRELADPSKADVIAKHLDYWYLAVPAGLTDGENVPDNWGIIEVKYQGGDTSEHAVARVKRKATKLEIDPVSNWHRRFLASVCRRISDDMSAEKRVREAYEQGLNAGLRQKRKAETNARFAQTSVDSFDAERIRLVKETEKRFGLSMFRSVKLLTQEAILQSCIDRVLAAKRNAEHALKTAELGIRQLGDFESRLLMVEAMEEPVAEQATEPVEVEDEGTEF